MQRNFYPLINDMKEKVYVWVALQRDVCEVAIIESNLGEHQRCEPHTPKPLGKIVTSLNEENEYDSESYHILCL